MHEARQYPLINGVLVTSSNEWSWHDEFGSWRKLSCYMAYYNDCSGHGFRESVQNDEEKAEAPANDVSSKLLLSHAGAGQIYEVKCMIYCRDY